MEQIRGVWGHAPWKFFLKTMQNAANWAFFSVLSGLWGGGKGPPPWSRLYTLAPWIQLHWMFCSFYCSLTVHLITLTVPVCQRYWSLYRLWSCERPSKPWGFWPKPLYSTAIMTLASYMQHTHAETWKRTVIGTWYQSNVLLWISPKVLFHIVISAMVVQCNLRISR